MIIIKMPNMNNYYESSNVTDVHSVFRDCDCALIHLRSPGGWCLVEFQLPIS